MAVDLHIGTIETTLSATDPATLLTPELIAAVVAAVRAELERDQQISARRESDRAPRVKRRL